MATIDYYLSPVDVKDSHVLTKTVERRVNESELYQVPFAPLTTTMSRKIKLRIRAINGAGLAAFKADNSDTPIASGSGDLTELFMELLLIGEKDILKQSDMISLQSPDELVARTAAEELISKAVNLRKRNTNRTKWMAWQASRGTLTVTYPDTTTIVIDYDLDGGSWNNWFSASHLPVTAVAWSDTTNGDIIEDVYNWSKIIADDLGCDQSEVIMYLRTAVWRNMKKNTGVKNELSSTSPRVITPKKAEIVEILGIGEIRINNEFYVSAGSQTKNYFLPETYVLLTGPDTVNGDPLMEMKDGPVARVVGESIVTAPNPGALSETYINKEAVTENVRVQTSRLPQMNFPAGFVWAYITA